MVFVVGLVIVGVVCMVFILGFCFVFGWYLLDMWCIDRFLRLGCGLCWECRVF